MKIGTIALLCLLPVSSLRLAQQNSKKEGDIYSHVDSSCKMSVDTKNKKIFLTTDIGNFVVADGKVEDENGKVIGSTTPKPMICESDTGSPDSHHSFIIVGSSAPYLWSYLDPFFNKHCFAKTNKMTYYLWFGEASAEMNAAYAAKTADAAQCSSGLGSSCHYFYPIGMKKILDEKPNVKWLVSMDLSDAFFNGAHFQDDALRKLLTDDLSDVAFAAQLGQSRTFVNGALWAIKNTEWSKQWLADVYKNRCGSMNQQSYWVTLLQHFKKEKPDFTFNEGSMSSYNGARGAMASAVIPMLSPEQQAVYKKYRGTAGMPLPEPLYFGKHMMLLPNAPPEGSDPKNFIGFRGDRSGGEPIMCHRPMNHKFFLKEKTGFDGQTDFDGQSEFETDMDEAESEASSNNCLRSVSMCAGGGSCMCD